MLKMWKICAVLSILSVIFTVGYLKFAKYQVGDCIQFDLFPDSVYKITGRRFDRYVLDNKIKISIYHMDKATKKVKCE